MRKMFPVKMVASDDQDGRFGATTSIERLRETSENLRRELGYVESDYRVLVHAVREIVARTSRSKRTDPRLYWLAGDNIVRFLTRIEDMGFYLVKQNRTLARDIGISESSVEKIAAFRRRFAKVSMVDPAIPWARYRSNSVKALSGARTSSSKRKSRRRA